MRGLHAAGTDGGAARSPDVPGLVSVVLPVYNQADLLGDSIRSVLDQTYDHFELIIVDDGSEDGVAEVLRRYIGHPKVRILRQSNQKLPRALSHGFAFARGEFWTWTSADNLMHPEQLARLVAFLGTHPDAAMVYADYVAIDDRGEPLADPSFRPQNRRPATSPEIHLPRDPREINVVRDNFIGPCFLYRSIVGRLIGDYDPGLGIEDYDYWMRVNHAFRIEHLGTDETLYRYRVHDRSLSGRAVELKIAERAAALMKTERAAEPVPSRALDRARRRLGRIGACRAARDRRIDGWTSPRRSPRRIGKARSSTWRIARASTPCRPRIGPSRRSWRPGSMMWTRLTSAGSRRPELGAIGFTGRREVAERLDLLGIPNLVVDSPDSFLDLAIRYANNRRFVERSRPEADRRGILPEPMLADRYATCADPGR